MNKVLVAGRNKVSFYDIHKRTEITSIRHDFEKLKPNVTHTTKYVVHKPQYIELTSPFPHNTYKPTQDSDFHNALETFVELAKAENGDKVIVYARRDTCDIHLEWDDAKDNKDITSWEQFPYADTIGVLGVSRVNVMGGNTILQQDDNDVLLSTHLSPAILALYKDNNIQMKFGPMRSYDRRNKGFQDVLVFVHMR